MKKKIYILGCLTLFLFCSCDSHQEAPAPMVKSETAGANLSAVKAQIQEIENNWAAAMNKKDLDALMALYTDDAESMQDGGPTLVGKAAIRAQQEKSFAAPARYASISFQTRNVYGTPEEVTEVGTSSEKDAAGKEIATGKYMAVFRMKDGKYRCIQEIYNRDSR